MSGQLTGFFSGLMLDFLSASPLGLNALVRTLIGACAGFFKGTFFLDFFFFPMLLCAGATIFKALIFLLLHLLFPDLVPSYTLLSLTLWVELGLNTLLAPFIFALLKLFSSLLVLRPRENS
jgi:rod shape-determining protein MreD